MRRYLLFVVAIALLSGSDAVSGPPRTPSKTRPSVATPSETRIGDGLEWLRSPPDDFPLSPEVLDESDAFEVVASAKSLCVSQFGGLWDRTFSKLTPDDARRLTGHYYRCPKGKTPYVVRAAYGNSVWGKFTFPRVGRKIEIRHDSLGHGFQAFKTAFVLNLDFEPEEVYVTVHIAE